MIDEIEKRWYSGILIVLGVIGAIYGILNFAPDIDFILIILTIAALVIALIIFFIPLKVLKKDKKTLSGIMLILIIFGFIYGLIRYDFFKFDFVLLVLGIIGFIVVLLLYYEPVGKKHGKKKM